MGAAPGPRRSVSSSRTSRHLGAEGRGTRGLAHCAGCGGGRAAPGAAEPRDAVRTPLPGEAGPWGLAPPRLEDARTCSSYLHGPHVFSPPEARPGRAVKFEKSCSQPGAPGVPQWRGKHHDPPVPARPAGSITLRLLAPGSLDGGAGRGGPVTTQLPRCWSCSSLLVNSWVPVQGAPPGLPTRLTTRRLSLTGTHIN